MLPLLGLELVQQRQGDPAALVALTIVVAQGVMVVASLAAMQFTSRRGYWLVLLVSFVALPLRGWVAATQHTAWTLYLVQALKGAGAGLQSVAVPGLVALLLNGTGRINFGQGAVMTVQGAGAACNPALGGWMSQEFGYPVAFATLGGLASLSIGCWFAARTTLLQERSP